MFLLLSIGRYFCWWYIRPRWFHSASSEYFSTHMVY